MPQVAESLNSFSPLVCKVELYLLCHQATWPPKNLIVNETETGLGKEITISL